MTIRLFLCGDVMPGRGIDQVLPRSCDPRLHERFVGSARRYVELAEEAHGPIGAPVNPAYPWGDALEMLEERAPDARIVNLETAVTTSDEAWPGKGVHYRMHPGNVALLRDAGIDCCVLANNHVLDWGMAGLRDTLEALQDAGIAAAGAGRDREEAAAPAALEFDGRRVLVFSFAMPGSGVPEAWTARGDRPGVRLLPDLSAGTAREVAGSVVARSGSGDLVVASVHWGPNWGYRIPDEQRDFARILVEEGGVDLVHGHSSHHPKGIEVHRGRPILYGCGDFLNDYEGISGREEYRGDLALMYLADLDADGSLERLEMVPLRIQRFRLERPPEEDRNWIAERMDRECRKLGSGVRASSAGSEMELRWEARRPGDQAG